MGDIENEAESKEAETSIDITKKAIKRKILPQKTTKDNASNIRLSTLKSRKLNPLPNLTNRNRKINSSQESINQENNKTQNSMLEKNKIMSQEESSSLVKIPTKNSFDVLQSQKSCPPQLQEPIQAIPAKISTNQNTI
jgi:hypothetical protein